MAIPRDPNTINLEREGALGRAARVSGYPPEVRTYTTRIVPPTGNRKPETRGVGVFS